MQLDLYKTECKRLHDERGRQNCERRHSSLDRSNSYPSTSSLSCTEVPFHSVSNMAMLPPSLGGNKNEFVHLEEFRYEQLKRVSVLVVWVFFSKKRTNSLGLF